MDIMDHQSNGGMIDRVLVKDSLLTYFSVVYVPYTRDALGNYALAQDFNFCKQFSGDGSQWGPQVSTISNALGWDDLRASTA